MFIQQASAFTTTVSSTVKQPNPDKNISPEGQKVSRATGCSSFSSFLLWWAQRSWPDRTQHVCIQRERQVFGTCFECSLATQEPGGAALRPRPASSLLSNSTAKSCRPDCKVPAAPSGRHLTGEPVEMSEPRPPVAPHQEYWWWEVPLF